MNRRVCAEDGCDTILSVYNHGSYCGPHEGAHERLSTLRWATAPDTKRDAQRKREQRRRQKLRESM